MREDKGVHDNLKSKASSCADAWLRLFNVCSDPVVVLDGANMVVFCNSSFENVFGWQLNAIVGKPFDTIGHDERKATEIQLQRLLKQDASGGLQIRMPTRSGRSLDVLVDAVVLRDDDPLPGGTVLFLRDVTRRHRRERERQLLLRLSDNLHRFSDLATLLDHTLPLVKDFMAVEGAAAILLDERNNQFSFQAAALADSAAADRMLKLRFPAHEGVAGEVYRSGRPLVVDDYPNCPYALKMKDALWPAETRNMLCVPLRLRERFLGVIALVNRCNDRFDEEDEKLLGAVAALVVLPFVNAGAGPAVGPAHVPSGSIGRSGGYTIHQLSHELKTPLAVLSASIRLLERNLPSPPDPKRKRISDRIERNLQRLLSLEYQLEDMLRGKDETCGCRGDGEEKI